MEIEDLKEKKITVNSETLLKGLEVLNQKKYTRLEYTIVIEKNDINHSSNRIQKDIKQIAKNKIIEEMSIFLYDRNYANKVNLNTLSQLPNLKSLTLISNNTDSYCIDFKLFPNLERFCCTRLAINFYNFHKLKNIIVYDFSAKDLSLFHNCEKLEDLDLLNATSLESLKGIEYCTSLKKLYCNNAPLKSIKEIDEVKTLQRFTLKKVERSAFIEVKELKTNANGICSWGLREAHISTEYKSLVGNNCKSWFVITNPQPALKLMSIILEKQSFDDFYSFYKTLVEWQNYPLHRSKGRETTSRLFYGLARRFREKPNEVISKFIDYSIKIAEQDIDKQFFNAIPLILGFCRVAEEKSIKPTEDQINRIKGLVHRVKKLSFMPRMTSLWDGILEFLETKPTFNKSDFLLVNRAYIPIFNETYSAIGDGTSVSCPISEKEILAEIQHNQDKYELKFGRSAIMDDNKYWVWTFRYIDDYNSAKRDYVDN